MTTTQFNNAMRLLSKAADRLEGVIDADDFYDSVDADAANDAIKWLDEIVAAIGACTRLLTEIPNRVPPLQSEHWPQIRAAWWKDDADSERIGCKGPADMIGRAREVGNDFGYSTHEIMVAIDADAKSTLHGEEERS